MSVHRYIMIWHKGAWMMIYRLLAMNIDGTILQSNGKLHKSVKEAVEYVQSKGVMVTLVTSRNFAFAKRMAKALKLQTMVIAHHGAFIASSSDQAIFVKRIDEQIVQDIIRFLETFSCHIRIVHEKYSVSNVPLKNSIVTRAVIDTNSFSTYHHQFVRNLGEYVEEEQIHPTHIEIDFPDQKVAKEVKIALQNMFYEIDLYLYDNQLIILPNGVSKLTGLLYFCEKQKISLNETVAIGSDIDDLDFIEAAGLGVAMGNAPIAVRKAADWVTRSNNEHGVSYMVREHFRKQQPISFLEKINSIKKSSI